MLTMIRDWYHKAFPDDEIYTSIDPKATFGGLLITLMRKKDVYDYIGIGDSVVRERLFQKLSILIGCDYDTIYSAWIRN